MTVPTIDMTRPDSDRGTYPLLGKCPNCFAKFIVERTKGDHAPYSVECPRCECKVFGWLRWWPAL